MDMKPHSKRNKNQTFLIISAFAFLTSLDRIIMMTTRYYRHHDRRGIYPSSPTTADRQIPLIKKSLNPYSLASFFFDKRNFTIRIIPSAQITVFTSLRIPISISAHSPTSHPHPRLHRLTYLPIHLLPTQPHPLQPHRSHTPLIDFWHLHHHLDLNHP